MNISTNHKTVLVIHVVTSIYLLPGDNQFCHNVKPIFLFCKIVLSVRSCCLALRQQHPSDIQHLV